MQLFYACAYGGGKRKQRKREQLLTKLKKSKDIIYKIFAFCQNEYVQNQQKTNCQNG